MYTWQEACLSLLNYDTLRTIPVGIILSFLGLWSCLPFLLLATLSDVLDARLLLIHHNTHIRTGSTCLHFLLLATLSEY